MTGVARNHLGRRFGLLVVIARAGTGSGTSAAWLCRCDCGAEKIIKANRLTQGRSRSCGCAQRDGRRGGELLP